MTPNVSKTREEHSLQVEELRRAGSNNADGLDIAALARSLMTKELSLNTPATPLKEALIVPHEVSQYLLTQVGKPCLQMSDGTPVNPTRAWCQYLPPGASYITWGMKHGDLSQYGRELEAMVSRHGPQSWAAHCLERLKAESLALLPIRAVGLCLSTISGLAITTQKQYEAGRFPRHFALVSFGPKTPENDRLASQAMAKFARLTRAVESHIALEQRLSSYVAKRMDRKLLKAFAMDFVDCVIAEGVKPGAKMSQYLAVLGQFSLSQAQERLSKIK